VLPEQSPSAVQPTHVSVLPIVKQCGVAPEHMPLHGTCASGCTPVSVPMSTGEPLSEPDAVVPPHAASASAAKVMKRPAIT
jgi:hypothetical protein